MRRPPDPVPAAVPTPRAHWEHDDYSAPDLIWWAQLDQRYLVEVVRVDPSGTAALRIYDHTRGDALLASHPVAVSGDPTDGPAIGDVVAWQRLAIEIVDGRRAGGHTEGELQ